MIGWKIECMFLKRHDCARSGSVISRILLAVYQLWWLISESGLHSTEPPVVHNGQLRGFEAGGSGRGPGDVNLIRSKTRIRKTRSIVAACVFLGVLSKYIIISVLLVTNFGCTCPGIFKHSFRRGNYSCSQLGIFLWRRAVLCSACILFYRGSGGFSFSAEEGELGSKLNFKLEYQ